MQWASFAVYFPLSSQISSPGRVRTCPASLHRLPEPSNPSGTTASPRERPGPPHTQFLRASYLVGLHPQLLQGRLEKLRRRFPHDLGFDTTGVLKRKRHSMGLRQVTGNYPTRSEGLPLGKRGDGRQCVPAGPGASEGPRNASDRQRHDDSMVTCSGGSGPLTARHPATCSNTQA